MGKSAVPSVIDLNGLCYIEYQIFSSFSYSNSLDDPSFFLESSVDCFTEFLGEPIKLHCSAEEIL